MRYSLKRLSYCKKDVGLAELAEFLTHRLELWVEQTRSFVWLVLAPLATILRRLESVQLAMHGRTDFIIRGPKDLLHTRWRVRVN